MTIRPATTDTHKPSGFSQLLSYVFQYDRDKDLLVSTDRTGIIRYLFLQVLPRIASFLVVLPLLRIYEKIKSYVKEPNKNLDNTLDLIFTLLISSTSITMTLLLALGLTYLGPYLIFAGLAIATVSGIYAISKNIFLAYTAHKQKNLTRRNEYLLAIPKALLMAILSGVGMLAHATWVFNFSQIVNLFSAGMSFFTQIKDVLILIGCLLTLTTIPGVVTKVVELNNNSMALLSSPVKAIKAFANAARNALHKVMTFVKAKPLTALVYAVPALVVAGFEIARILVRLISRVVALTFLPIQGMVHLVMAPVWNAASRLTKDLPSTHKTVATTPVSMAVVAPANSYHANYKLLKTRLSKKIVALEQQPATQKRNAKLFFTRQMYKKLGKSAANLNLYVSIAAVEADAKSISPKLYTSFWTLEKGDTAEISRQMKSLQASYHSMHKTPDMFFKAKKTVEIPTPPTPSESLRCVA